MAGNVFSDKQALRKEVEGRRRALRSDVVNRWGGEVQRHLAALPLFSDRVIRAVAVYQPQAFEVPLHDFVLELSARGVVCAFPRLVRGERVLAFHSAPDEWIAGPLGLREPPTHAPRHEISGIDVFIVPGVAFTRTGARLGRGGGYYDATLARRGPQALCIGVSFECCVVDAIPTEAHDVAMDLIVTERGAFQR